MSGFFAILDDIATLMDDVAVMTKVAAKKTAGLLGDDLAVGAEKGSSFRASRELPVLWAITKGSFLNKLIILPFVFLMSAYTPWLIVPILLIGGMYLSFEGMEKIMHTFFIKEHHQTVAAKQDLSEEELLKIEKAKIKSTILTDFILSIEIIMITLGTVTEEELVIQMMVVSVIAILATIAVYGLVAFLVRLDDMGYGLIKKAKGKSKAVKSFFAGTGKFLVWLLPKTIKFLAVIGTIAMLLVGGGMFVHNIPYIHDLFHNVPMILSELIMGIIVGLITFFIIFGIKKIWKKE